MQEDQKKLEQFQARMSEWVASQGLLFQLTHGGQRASSAFMGWVTRMGLRLVALLLAGCLVIYVFLLRLPFSVEFSDRIKVAMQTSLDAASTEIGSTARKDGMLELSSLEMVGSEETFFDSVRARNIKTRMRVLNGIAGSWHGDFVRIERLEMKVKSGSEKLPAQTVFGAIFDEGNDFVFERIDVADATISWGYSTTTSGQIQNTRLSAEKVGNSWKVRLEGGSLSQNWLQDLRIDALECNVSPEGIEIVESALGTGEGALQLSGVVKGPVVDPRVEMAGSMKQFPLEAILDPNVRSVIQGRVSGEIQMGGSPYGQGGITMAAQFELEEGDEVILTDEIDLLGALSLVDRHRSYKKVRFRSGRFNLETGRNVAAFTGIRLLAKDHLRLEGELISRPPSEKEVSQAILKTEVREEVHNGVNTALAGQTEEEIPGKFNLADAARIAREAASDSDEQIRTIFQSEVFGQEVERREQEARSGYRRIPYLEGDVRMGLEAGAFEEKRSPILSELFPVEEESGVRWLEVRLDDSLPFICADLCELVLSHAKN